MSAYAPLPRPVARRLWLAEALGALGVGVTLWLCGRLLEPAQLAEVADSFPRCLP